MKLSSTASDPPAHNGAPPRPLHNLAGLTLMLADGWQIEAPVLARLSWAQRHSGEMAYHIILARASQRSLIVVADSPEFQQFLCDHRLRVA